MMMTANLVGFVIGTDGMSFMLQQLISGWEGTYRLFALARLVALILPRRIQVYVSWPSHAGVCSLRRRSCLNTGKRSLPFRLLGKLG